MTDNDPFSAFESDRTVIKPSAGRARAAATQPAGHSAAGVASPPLHTAATEGALPLEGLMTASLNPLVSAAMPLLSTAARIRHMVQHPNPAALKDALVQGLQKFETQARSQSLPPEQIVAARYILCTLLDESAASTPWGSAVWSSQSLLVKFHNETWGGEKVFQLLGKLAENIPANRNLLELSYVALALGFEGRYRVLDNGKAQLDAVRTRLAHMLRENQSAPEKALAVNWKSTAAVGQQHLTHSIPLWVMGAAMAGGLLLAYMAFSWTINSRSDPVFAALQALDIKAPALTSAAPAISPTAAPAAPAPRLATLLKPEIEAGLLDVQDLADRSVITIKGDGFFAPSSADIANQVRPLLARIDDALATFTGPVLVTGHSDNRPIRSLRYPSNWHLSQDRAQAVTHTLQKVGTARLRAEGKSDSEPVADNEIAEGRARNRRVEITLFVQQAQP